MSPVVLGGTFLRTTEHVQTAHRLLNYITARPDRHSGHPYLWQRDDVQCITDPPLDQKL